MLSGCNLLFILISSAILVLLFWILVKKYANDSIRRILLQFILAGGVSNVIDRIFRGYVVDFIALKPFGIFNFSDVFIVISMCIILFFEIKELSSGNNKKNSN